MSLLNERERVEMNRYYFLLFLISICISFVCIYLSLSEQIELGVGSYASGKVWVRRYELMSVVFLNMSIGCFLLSCPSDREK